MNLQSDQSEEVNRRKRWIICADGTWNEPEQTDQGAEPPTNVCKLAAAVLPYDQNGICRWFSIMPASVSAAVNWIIFLAAH